MCEECNRLCLAWYDASSHLEVVDVDDFIPNDATWQVIERDRESVEYRKALEKYRQHRRECNG